MSSVKTIIPQLLVEQYLEAKCGPINNLQMVTGGETSQAFSFSTPEQDLVVRVNTSDQSYQKDFFVQNNFLSSSIPSPKIISLERSNEYFFCISEKLPGVLLDTLTQEEHLLILEPLFDVLTTIHAQDISDYTGFGKWKETGNASSPSWTEYISSFGDETTWRELAQEFDFDVVLQERLRGKFQELISYLPETRHLIHGDFGYNNVFTDKRTITGVIDWGESLYGDPLFDISWLAFWSSHIDFPKKFHEYAYRHDLVFENYEERVRCYELYIAITTLEWFAETHQSAPYQWTKGRVQKYLSQDYNH